MAGAFAYPYNAYLVALLPLRKEVRGILICSQVWKFVHEDYCSHIKNFWLLSSLFYAVKLPHANFIPELRLAFRYLAKRLLYSCGVRTCGFSYAEA